MKNGHAAGRGEPQLKERRKKKPRSDEIKRRKKTVHVANRKVSLVIGGHKKQKAKAEEAIKNRKKSQSGRATPRREITRTVYTGRMDRGGGKKKPKKGKGKRRMSKKQTERRMRADREGETRPKGRTGRNRPTKKKQKPWSGQRPRKRKQKRGPCKGNTRNRQPKAPWGGRFLVWGGGRTRNFKKKRGTERYRPTQQKKKSGVQTEGRGV